MRLRPRHYLLIAIIVALGVYNLYRARHPRAASTAPPAREAAPIPPQAAAAWAAFDKAASLRDAPAAQYTPAAEELQHQIEIADPPSVVTDVKGCQTWLNYYRQSNESAWRARAVKHLDTCVAQHADVG